MPTAAALKARPELAPPELIGDTVPPQPPTPSPDVSLDPSDVPSSPALRAAPQLLATEIGPGAPVPPDPPHQKPEVRGGRGSQAVEVDIGGLPTPPRLDPKDLPTPPMLRPVPGAMAAARRPDPDASDVPSADNLAPEDQPTPSGLTPSSVVAKAARGPLSGPTRPMQVIDVRAALAAEDLPTARMDSNPDLLLAENDLRTRPMAAQKNIAEVVQKKQAAQLGPEPEEAETVADVPVPAAPTPPADQSDGDWASGEMDPFFFED